MYKLSQIIDATRESLDALESPLRQPHSPLTINTSAPASPAVSLFSAAGHNRVSSSVSSLVSSSGLGNSMDSSSRSQLTGVKEEDCTRDSLEDHYFQHFDRMSAADSYFSPIDNSDTYDLSVTGMETAPSPKKRRSGSDTMSLKGVSRINSHISTMSARWKTKRSSSGDGDTFPDALRSRANSAASSALASPTTGPVPVSRVDSIPPSPARTIFEERASESSVRPIDITRANSLSQDDNDVQQATTPLLPPFMRDDPMSNASRVQSPLQSPSVADASEAAYYTCNVTSDPRFMGNLPSPPLSSKPSVASFNRPRASTVRTVSGDVTPLVLSDPNDEWANKLGHANFTIMPEPYEPVVCDLGHFQQLRGDWDIARCNFAKHLVRTGEHYGMTSNIYKLTIDKWDSINREWAKQHEAMLDQLSAIDGVALTLTHSNIHPCQQLRIPRLHDNDKFPEMGDEDIVGPMTVAPAAELAGPCRSEKKRSFFRFFQDLVSRP
ncbi:hypothetical protein DTO006G1_5772 [Penicillium roqueforti]|nr:hypothetical protein CBS147337_2094 [Penicillium roqueforti]KAI2677900.1 hypothetical protein CBS147355_4901 [Penicillium roqueforti]KAI2704264.1 hypothetical protein CBS147372_2733 [Penicillium roqueforti]KAI2716044.1 hypothetical protein CBS147318_5895 [Penicillium roqueforti]KAI2759359.1 hypothetical protein DTO006G1_5772 [Penicillium roqueforti]